MRPLLLLDTGNPGKVPDRPFSFPAPYHRLTRTLLWNLFRFREIYWHSIYPKMNEMATEG